MKLQQVVKNIEKNYFKHDLPLICIGDTVKIMETRPLSKTKRWRLVEVVEKVK